MKLIPGNYKIPEMFPKSTSFPGAYKVTNLTDELLFLKLYTPTNTFWDSGLSGNDSVCLYLEEGQYLKVTKTVEIVPFDPEG